LRCMRPNARRSDALLADFFAQDGPLAREKAHYYRRRPEQLELARAVERTLSEKGVLLCDAPTGTGKSIGYISPAILRAAGVGERVVISTATISLQSQLLSEDIPPVRAATASLIGYPEEEGVSYSVMKGRANFLCSQRHQDTLRTGAILEGEVLENLDRWAAATTTGDREDLDLRLPVSTWLEVASDGEDCAPNACAFREGCFYYAHRDRAQEADILVVNHALLLANVASYGNIFDTEGRHLIIDEAHRLEEIMAEAFGARVSYPRVRYVMRQAKKKCESAHDDADRAQMAAEAFFEELRSGQELGSEKKAPCSYRALEDSLRSVRNILASDPREEVNALQGMVGRLRRDLLSFYSEPDDDYAYAVVAGRSKDPTRKPYPELRSWLVDTAEAFRDGVLPLFEDGGVILTSATLANGAGERRSFGYARRRLGLEDKPNGRRVREHASREIFDYEGRVLIYVEEEMEAPTLSNTYEYAEACAARTRELMELAKAGTGDAEVDAKALVLLSTSRAVSVFREAFRPPDGMTARFQGEDSPGRLLSWLRESEGGAVLVGTRGFWEGSDVPGLSLVVIDRAPFAPPDDPVIKKLVERAGDGWFRHVMLPKAQVAMRQGAGRLMRRPEDRGVIALLDSRISSKGWGKSILASLPPAPRTSSLVQVKSFFSNTLCVSPTSMRTREHPGW
jgi:ATP-dependent DNA helicase DinG